MQSEFSRRVYAATSAVPRGFVSTYGDIAKSIGCRSAQAVGQALRRNPFAPDVPCHRVVAGDLSTGGFFGEKDGEAVARKIELLKQEGVSFEGGGKIANSSRYHFDDPAVLRSATEIID